MCEMDEKPLIAILMAVYEPRMDWLKEQLCSLNAQEYPNLRLYVRDDSSSEDAFKSIVELIEECVTSFPFSITRNEKNLGSNMTFELLTQEAQGEYFAYCDQDDIWITNKLGILQEALVQEHAMLVCSDMYIIDCEGNCIADSITKVRKHHIFHSGTNLAKKLLISNFVTGCTMLISSECAKDAVPFCPFMVHDHYLALCAAQKGKIVSLNNRLIYYRIHDNNQTLVMAGVNDKNSYCSIRINPLICRLIWLGERFQDDILLRQEIDLALCWAKARAEVFAGNRNAIIDVFRKRKYSPLTSIFEIIFSSAPEHIFMFCIMLVRHNIF